ncbi:hypothetical protein PHLCEN_2v9242 [Hermanssonia centrifuga]|uniref:Uncharacterized protein n=1 Tax=Hermanssonia centrifuga TaxID=98765 RepID=A0A2R6NRC2_9APHY|nr:hypothetical protein PHLCEN_2v9242 [Hermanssonia centrifuga]
MTNPSGSQWSWWKEGETPQPFTSVLSVRVEELEDADETALVGKGEAQSRTDKVQPRTTSDF